MGAVHDPPPEAASVEQSADPSLGDDSLLTPEEVAAHLRTTDRTLERWRGVGYGPRFARIGPKRIAYRLGDVREFIRRSMV